MEKKINKTQKKANKVKVEANFLLVIAITTIVALALNTLALILHNSNEQAAQVFDILSFPAGVASIVFTILNFTKWNVVRDQTKVNYRWVLVPYIVTLALAVALGLALAVFMGTKAEATAHVIVHSISLPIDLFTSILSFILQGKVRKYA